MLQNTGRDTEILLGNKQLLGVFFVVAVLLGVAFTGGYMVGRGSGSKSAPIGPSAAGGETKVVTPVPPTESRTTSSIPPDDTSATAPPYEAGVQPKEPSRVTEKAAEPPPLGSPNRKEFTKTHTPEVAPTVVPFESASSFLPQPGQQFLQVAAVSKDEAEAVADVLHKKGFHAHAVPKPGNQKLYRVLIGPVVDAGELSSTRDALRRTGFREVIVQHY